jgi:two-component system, OmpR family, sensor histidine kinase KdpD
MLGHNGPAPKRPGVIRPCIPTRAIRPPVGPQWIHEIKHDGYRLIARKRDDKVRLFTRRGYDWSERYPLIRGAVEAIETASAVIDGEAVCCDDTGVAVFERLHSCDYDDQAFLYAFDLLELDGEDRRPRPLEERKARLEKLIANAPAGVQYSEHLEGDGAAIFCTCLQARVRRQIYRAIEDHLATHAQRKVVLFGAGSPETGEDSQPGDAAVPEPVRAAITDVQRGHSIEANVTDDTGNVWHVRRVSQKTPDFGVIAIDLGRVPADAAADVHQRVNDMLTDAADTLERLDVAHALDQAKMRSETELLREALIGSVSHELRTPLASILGAATVLSQSPAVVNDARLTSLASVVRDEAERLNNDIQNLLDATRISREQIKPRMEWIEPADIVNSALERRRRRLNGHTVSLDLDSNLPFIYVDPVLIEQAFAQVVDNAAKYSPAGSTITVAAKRNGHGLVLSVRDTGVGLTEEENAQLGDRFFRGARHASNISGSGLGLWIAKAFVSANGGRIEADSAGINLGTTIAIRLPVAPNAPQQETDPDD